MTTKTKTAEDYADEILHACVGHRWAETDKHLPLWRAIRDGFNVVIAVKPQPDVERAPDTADRGLTLATLCDMVLGEDAKDRSDDALIKAVGTLKREHDSAHEQAP